MTRCTLTPDSGGIVVKTPYDAGFVADLKSRIPYADRRWKGETKVWIVTPSHGATVQDLCNKHFGELPLLPTGINTRPTITQKIIDVRYIGATKDRGDDERSAYGWYADGWNVIFPESVLRAWFDAPQYPDEAPTLYSVLGVKRTATPDEIKSGYRRMALQWHPDKCKEPNAAEQFMTVQRAYDILSKNRDRYDAGLALEASLHGSQKENKRYSVGGLSLAVALWAHHLRWHRIHGAFRGEQNPHVGRYQGQLRARAGGELARWRRSLYGGMGMITHREIAFLFGGISIGMCITLAYFFIKELQRTRK